MCSQDDITEGANLFALAHDFQDKSVWKVYFSSLGHYFLSQLNLFFFFLSTNPGMNITLYVLLFVYVCVYEVWFRCGLAWQPLQKAEVSDSDRGCFAWADRWGAVVWEAKEFTASTFHLHRWAWVYVCVRAHAHARMCVFVQHEGKGAVSAACLCTVSENMIVLCLSFWVILAWWWYFWVCVCVHARMCVSEGVCAHINIGRESVRRVTTMIREASDPRQSPGGSALQFSRSERYLFRQWRHLKHEWVRKHTSSHVCAYKYNKTSDQTSVANSKVCEATHLERLFPNPDWWGSQKVSGDSQEPEWNMCLNNMKTLLRHN